MTTPLVVVGRSSSQFTHVAAIFAHELGVPFELQVVHDVDHVSFRRTLSLEPYPALVRFAADFATRPSAQRTQYRYDAVP